MKLFRVLRCFLSKSTSDKFLIFFLPFSEKCREKHRDPLGEVNWERESNRAEPDEAAFSWFCCWPKGISGRSAKWKLSPHVESRDWERGESVEPSGSAVGFRVFALPTQLCPVPSANPSVYVCHGEERDSRQCRGRWGRGHSQGSVGRRRRSARRLQISKMHTDLVHPLPLRVVANCSYLAPLLPTSPPSPFSCFNWESTPARTKRCLARRFSKLKGF